MICQQKGRDNGCTSKKAETSDARAKWQRQVMLIDLFFITYIEKTYHHPK